MRYISSVESTQTRLQLLREGKRVQSLEGDQRFET